MNIQDFKRRWKKRGYTLSSEIDWIITEVEGLMRDKDFLENEVERWKRKYENELKAKQTSADNS